MYGSCSTLIELAQKFGYTGNYLDRVDYEYINFLKTRDTWKGQVKKGQFEQNRYLTVRSLQPEQLTEVMNSPGIETVSHLATHFLLSQRHGRGVLKDTVAKLHLEDAVPDKLYKGFYGVSRKPHHYPTRSYEKRQGPKPLICKCCGFQSSKPIQMEIHHMSNTGEYDSKPKESSTYYTTTDVEVICANCHTLKHRVGDHLMEQCGRWRRKPPIQLSYDNPSDIFSNDCPFDYKTQKKYYLRWHLRKPEDYKCAKCGAIRWGRNNQVLVLELNHIDGIRKNSQLTNLELLCPNCHRFVHTTEKKGQPIPQTPKPEIHRVYINPDVD